MKRLLIGIAFLLLPLAALSGAAAGQTPEFKEDIHYFTIASGKPSTGNGIEVLEFFWYGCPHCHEFEPTLNRWLKSEPEGVRFARVPAVFSKPGLLHAQAYYALELVGAPDSVNGAIFEQFHVRKKPLNTVDALADFVASQGVNRQEFVAALESFAVDTKVRRAQVLAERYGIRGVPALVVDGRYRSGSVRSYDEMIEVANYLIDKVAQERRQASAQLSLAR